MYENTKNSQIKLIIQHHSILRGFSPNSAPLKPHEQLLNATSLAICRKIPQLLFHRKDLKFFTLQIRCQILYSNYLFVILFIIYLLT